MLGGVGSLGLPVKLTKEGITVEEGVMVSNSLPNL